MNIRTAIIADIPEILDVRSSVKENVLSDPSLVTPNDCIAYITERGKGWVCEVDKQIVGFSIIDGQEHNVWALFVRPEFAEKGIGRQLHDIMLDWYFAQTTVNVWLGTSPNTRAEHFYRKAGWKEIGNHGNDELKFEMTYDSWVSR